MLCTFRFGRASWAWGSVSVSAGPRWMRSLALGITCVTWNAATRRSNGEHEDVNDDQRNREATTMRDIKRDTGAVKIPDAPGDWVLDPSEAGDDDE